MKYLALLPKLVAFLNTVKSVFKQYPAVSAGVTDVVIVVAARFGLHLTADEVVTVAGVATAVLTALVHMNVTPAAKITVANDTLTKKVSKLWRHLN